VGLGTTVTETVEAELQPMLLVPVTEYTVVAVGVITWELPDRLPGCQV
jgi:hypothetical protein